jgi:hypothetical protein
MGSWINARIRTDRHSGAFAGVARNLADQIYFAGGFDIEEQNIGFECEADFICGFADAGKNDLSSITAGSFYAIKLASGNNVEANAPSCKSLKYGQVRVCFDGVAD